MFAMSATNARDEGEIPLGQLHFVDAQHARDLGEKAAQVHARRQVLDVVLLDRDQVRPTDLRELRQSIQTELARLAQPLDGGAVIRSDRLNPTAPS